MRVLSIVIWQWPSELLIGLLGTYWVTTFAFGTGGTSTGAVVGDTVRGRAGCVVLGVGLEDVDEEVAGCAGCGGGEVLVLELKKLISTPITIIATHTLNLVLELRVCLRRMSAWEEIPRYDFSRRE